MVKFFFHTNHLHLPTSLIFEGRLYFFPQLYSCKGATDPHSPGLISLLYSTLLTGSLPALYYSCKWMSDLSVQIDTDE